MIIESRIVVQGMTVAVKWIRRPRGYSAELSFDGGDRAVLDASSLGELEKLVELTAWAAVLARQSGRAVETVDGAAAHRRVAARVSSLS